MLSTIKQIIETIDQQYRETNPYWMISPETGVLLNTLARARNATMILEVGTSIGYSALYLADAAAATGGQVITIESHAERFLQATNHFQQAAVNTIVTQIKGHAPEVFVDLPYTFDLVFLDATKQEHPLYVEALKGKLSPHALVISDNVISHAKEMQPFLNNMHADSAFQHSIIPIGTGLLLSIYKGTN